MRTFTGGSSFPIIQVKSKTSVGLIYVYAETRLPPRFIDADWNNKVLRIVVKIAKYPIPRKTFADISDHCISEILFIEKSVNQKQPVTSVQKAIIEGGSPLWIFFTRGA